MANARSRFPNLLHIHVFNEKMQLSVRTVVLYVFHGMFTYKVLSPSIRNDLEVCMMLCWFTEEVSSG